MKSGERFRDALSIVELDFLPPQPHDHHLCPVPIPRPARVPAMWRTSIRPMICWAISRKRRSAPLPAWAVRRRLACAMPMTAWGAWPRRRIPTTAYCPMAKPGFGAGQPDLSGQCGGHLRPRRCQPPSVVREISEGLQR